MTAYVHQQPSHSFSAATPNCSHARILFGLDRAYCPDCKRGFSPKSPEYQAVLHPAPDKPTVTQSLSGATSDPMSGAHSQADLKSAPDKHWVEVYSPAKRNDSYYRYVWMEGRKLSHIHIKGGNAKRPLAIARASQVEAAIREKRSPAEIMQMMKLWSKKP